MQIRHINSPKAGLIEHIENVVGRTLVAAGLAEYVPYRNYQERLAAEGASQTVGSVQNVNVVGIEWGFIDAERSLFRIPVVVKRFGAESTWFSSPPSDCPASILKQFLDGQSRELTPEEIEQRRVSESKERDARQEVEQSEKLGMARLTQYFRT